MCIWDHDQNQFATNNPPIKSNMAAKVVKPLSRSKFRKILRLKLQKLQAEAQALENNTEDYNTLQQQSKPKTLKNDATDLLVYLNYMQFLTTLVKEVKILQMKDNSGELSPVHLNNIRSMLLKKFRG